MNDHGGIREFHDSQSDVSDGGETSFWLDCQLQRSDAAVSMYVSCGVTIVWKQNLGTHK